MLTNEIMYKALIEKDVSYEGTFIAAIKTTGIFCRPSCTARKPKAENVEFLNNAREAILKGYRPCKICNPLERIGETPAYIKEVLDALNNDPSLKYRDWDLRLRGVEPAKIRRWFIKNHGITFHSYQRMYRINSAFKKIQNGETVTSVAFDSGFDSLSGFNDSFKAVFGVSPSKSKTRQIINITRIETPLGTMLAGASENGICLLEFTDRRMLETELKSLSKLLNAQILQGGNAHFIAVKEQLEEYFIGKRKEFDIPLVTPGSVFQVSVWNELRKIPYGTTRSYKQQAAALEMPGAIRAVANTNGLNRISILIPCHRVIGSDGSLTGYGGGLWRKKWLLDMEHSHS